MVNLVGEATITNKLIDVRRNILRFLIVEVPLCFYVHSSSKIVDWKEIKSYKVTYVGIHGNEIISANQYIYSMKPTMDN